MLRRAISFDAKEILKLGGYVELLFAKRLRKAALIWNARS